MILKDMFQSLDRRTFLKFLSATGIAALIEPRRLLASMSQNNMSRFIFVENKAATTGFTINASVVQNMVNKGITLLANTPDLGEAWKSLLPGITPAHTVAVKVNAFSSQIPTHPDVTYAVVNSLRQMCFGAEYFPENNIIIYDRWQVHLADAGYTINTSGTGVRCFGTIGSSVGYSSETYSVNGVTQRLSNIVTEMADYLINIAVLKNHAAAGVTGCMKNHYGTVENPDQLHGSFCNPYIPALNSLDPILSKQCVFICDALFGIYEGGPDNYPQFIPNMLLMSNDIVSVDFWERELLKVYGCQTLDRAGHIDTAAEAPYSLGTKDPSQMDILTASDTISSSNYPESLVKPENLLLEQNHPNPFSGRTQIRFYVSETENIDITIYDVAGRRVRSLFSQTKGAGWHTVGWDGYCDSGRSAASGVYFCLLRTKKHKKSIAMHLLR